MYLKNLTQEIIHTVLQNMKKHSSKYNSVSFRFISNYVLKKLNTRNYSHSVTKYEETFFNL